MPSHYIDYITLLLVNTAAGLLIAAGFFWRGIKSPNPKNWASPMAAVGLVSFVVGLHMALTWPVGRPWFGGGEGMVKLAFANSAFGEASVLMGVLFLAIALSLAKGWDLVPVSIYAVFVGATAIVFGAAMGFQGLTQMPALTMSGYVLAGLAGVLTPVALSPQARPVRLVVAGLLIVSAAIWSLTAGLGIWGHMAMLSK